MDAMTGITSCDIGVWTLTGDSLPLLWGDFFFSIDTEERRKRVVDPDFQRICPTSSLVVKRGNCQKALTYFLDEGCSVFFLQEFRDRLVKHGRISRFLSSAKEQNPPLPSFSNTV